MVRVARSNADLVDLGFEMPDQKGGTCKVCGEAVGAYDNHLQSVEDVNIVYHYSCYHMEDVQDEVWLRFDG